MTLRPTWRDVTSRTLDINEETHTTGAITRSKSQTTLERKKLHACTDMESRLTLVASFSVLTGESLGVEEAHAKKPIIASIVSHQD